MIWILSEGCSSGKALGQKNAKVASCSSRLEEKNIFAVAEIVLRIRIQDYPLCEADHQKSLKGESSWFKRLFGFQQNMCSGLLLTMSSLKLIVANTDWIQIKRFLCEMNHLRIYVAPM